MTQELRDEGLGREKCSETRGYRQVFRDERLETAGERRGTRDKV